MPFAPDALGCFVPGPPVEMEGASEGPLAGLTLAVKDLFDTNGHVTGGGNPMWARTHSPADGTASAVAKLLAAGAKVIGKTITDELAFALSGENHHYGTPKNPAAPGRIPGGSSSGSASATAGGLCDIGLGTDTGGSVRVPASFCGLFGIRPSHGAVPLDRCMALAPSFDTCGWFARDGALLAKVGDVLLPPAPVVPVHRLLFAEDAFACIEPAARASMEPALAAATRLYGRPEPMILSPDGLPGLVTAFRTLQMAEIWSTFGAWIRTHNPEFGPGVQQRFDAAAEVSAAQVAAAAVVRARFVERLAWLMPPGTALLMPTAPGAAPLAGIPTAAMDAHRASLQQLTSPAGLARLPQVSMPFGRDEGCPLGLSLLAAHGQDRALLAAVAAIAGAL